MSNKDRSEKAKTLPEAAYLRGYREGQRPEGVWANNHSLFSFHIKQAFSSKSESTTTHYVSRGKESLLVLSLLTTSLKTELSTVSSYHPQHCTQ